MLIVYWKDRKGEKGGMAWFFSWEKHLYINVWEGRQKRWLSVGYESTSDFFLSLKMFYILNNTYKHKLGIWKNHYDNYGYGIRMLIYNFLVASV